MTAIAVLLAVISGAVSLIWSSRHLKIRRERKHGFVLTGEYAGPGDKPPLVSVVVAAKDEEACIDTCVRTMLSQDYPNFEMIVCNDRSTDRTAQIVSGLCEEDTRLRLVNIDHLPEGWCGKNNAMQTGISTANGEWLCMIDADCRQLSNRTISVAVQYAIDNHIDMLSVLPILEMKGLWENAIQPVCSGVMMIWYDPDKVNNPKSRPAYANGAFILISREAYMKIGTHEAVRDKVNEDMHMADITKKAGLKLRVVRSQGLYMVRMYTSLRSILLGWSRIFYGTFGTLGRLIASFALMFCMGVVPYISAALGLAAYFAGAGTAWLVTGLLGLAAVVMQVSVIGRFYKLIKAKPVYCLTYWLGCLITLYAIILSISKLRKGAKLVWRNTSYAVTTKD